MAILGDSDLKKAVAGPPLTRFPFNKASIASQIAGGYTSLWRATGLPAQGAIPSAAAVCTDALTGAPAIPTKTSGYSVYAAAMWAVMSIASGLFLVDRLAHNGGLSGTVTTAQTAGVSASTLAGTRCATDYSDVEWFLEWYTATGSTAVTATAAVTYNDDSTGNVTVSIPASTAASRRLPILSAVAGKWIKSVQTVTLSATTGTAGSFGVTAVRVLGEMACDTANAFRKADWAMIELPILADDACLELMTIPSSTTSGTVVGRALIVQG